jgi:hypothetical protein
VLVEAAFAGLILTGFLARAGQPARFHVKHLLHRAVTIIWRL